jgi:hypothetical protein
MAGLEADSTRSRMTRGRPHGMSALAPLGDTADGTESSMPSYEYTNQAALRCGFCVPRGPAPLLSPGAKSPQSTASNGHGWCGLTSRGRSCEDGGCTLSNGGWIRAAANVIAFSRTRHAAAAPKHHSRCGGWISRRNEAKDSATWHVRARPQPSVMRFDNRPADRQPKPQTARFRAVEGFEHAIKIRRCEAWT